MPTLIDTSGATRIGNMTGGNGLIGALDNNSNTQGYNTQWTGWAGWNLPVAKKIDSVTIKSPSLGFDSSGALSKMTWKLFGKNIAPVRGDDGIELGSLTFTDVNARTSRTIQNTNYPQQTFKYVWVYGKDGVYTTLEDALFYEPETEIVIPVEGNHERLTHRLSCNDSVNLTYAGAVITQFTKDFRLVAPAAVEFHFFCDVVHRGGVTGYNDALSIGAALGLKTASTFEGLANASTTWAENGKSGRNLCELNPQHYECLQFFYPMQLNAGFYRAFISMNAATDAQGYTTTNGLAGILVEGSKGNNCFMIKIDYGGVVV